uniref:Uncharacterized protein n=2 Tax=Lutzomyia longipalpis TaxID=7200 RepID=A0A1B0CVS6_LUTLO
CLATIATVYWRSNEESVEGDKPQKAPVLESRETVYASNSRADRVQANNSGSIFENSHLRLVTFLLTLVLTTAGASPFQSLSGSDNGATSATR